MARRTDQAGSSPHAGWGARERLRDTLGDRALWVGPKKPSGEGQAQTGVLWTDGLHVSAETHGLRVCKAAGDSPQGHPPMLSLVWPLPSFTAPRGMNIGLSCWMESCWAGVTDFQPPVPVGDARNGPGVRRWDLSGARDKGDETGDAAPFVGI